MPLLVVLKLVTEVAVDNLDAGRVPCLAMELVGESSRKAATGMVARREVDLKRTCFLGRCNQAVKQLWGLVCGSTW
jgi:hypothetical protein